MQEPPPDLIFRARRTVEPTWHLTLVHPMNNDEVILDKTYYTLQDISDESRGFYSMAQLKAYSRGKNNPPKYMKLERINKANKR